jgi:O-antigen ligase
VLLFGGLAIASAASASRLTVSSPDRSNEWHATWAVATAHPGSGVGPSHLHLEWRGTNGDTFVAHATHNEFLQLAAEQGFPALAVALVTIGLIAIALVRRGQRAALAVLAAFAVASAFDFVWHVALIPIVVAAVVGAALPFESYGRPAPTK